MALVAVPAVVALVAAVAVAAFPVMSFASALVLATNCPEELVPTTAADAGGVAPASCNAFVAVVAEVADVALVAVAALPEVLFANVPVLATSWPEEFVPTTAADVGGAAPAS